MNNVILKKRISIMQISNLAPCRLKSDNNYIMDSSNEIVNMWKAGRGNQSTIVQFQDATEWVHLGDRPVERFCGFLYLEKTLNEFNVSSVQAAENKIAILNKQIIYLSKYYGDIKPQSLYKYRDELSILDKDVRFTDTIYNANLRENDGKVYVFDTEKTSFDKSVHEKIDSFNCQHNAIRSIVEESLKNNVL